MVSEQATGEKGAGSLGGRWAERHHHLYSNAVLTSTPLASGHRRDETTARLYPELSSRHSPIAVTEKQPATSSSFDAATCSGPGELVSEEDEHSLLSPDCEASNGRHYLAPGEEAPPPSLQLSTAPPCAPNHARRRPRGGGEEESGRDATTELEVRLRAQGEVNRELKRLLVASVGSGLQQRLEQLAAEKAGLSRDLDLSLNRLAAVDEELDRVAIACDVWRSKFLASRVMVDELVDRRTDGRRALRCLLAERAQLARDVVKCHLHLSRALASLRTMAAAASHGGNAASRVPSAASSTLPDGREACLHEPGETETRVCVCNMCSINRV